MSRGVIYEKEEMCDICGAVGAYDFMGDLICHECLMPNGVEKEMKLKKVVYIASPYTKGDVAVNVRNTILMADKLVEAGFLPFWPLSSHFWHLVSPHPYEYWTGMDMEWLYHVDCVLRLPGESSGADAEVKFAIAIGLPVYYSFEELIASQA